MGEVELAAGRKLIMDKVHRPGRLSREGQVGNRIIRISRTLEIPSAPSAASGTKRDNEAALAQAAAASPARPPLNADRWD